MGGSLTSLTSPTSAEEFEVEGGFPSAVDHLLGRVEPLVQGKAGERNPQWLPATAKLRRRCLSDSRRLSYFGASGIGLIASRACQSA